MAGCCIYQPLITSCSRLSTDRFCMELFSMAQYGDARRKKKKKNNTELWGRKLCFVFLGIHLGTNTFLGNWASQWEQDSALSREGPAQVPISQQAEWEGKGQGAGNGYLKFPGKSWHGWNYNLAPRLAFFMEITELSRPYVGLSSVN